MPGCRRSIAWNVLLVLTLPLAGAASGDDSAAGREGVRPKRVLLLGQSPDSHPFAAHEYMAGVQLLAKMTQPHGLQAIVVKADEPWKEGPELLDGADAAVLFLSEGAKWLSNDAARLEAFRRLAKRGGGLAVIHWGMGTRDAANVPAFVSLFGGCHGGPDRKYSVLTAKASLAAPKHPVLAGLSPFEIEEEFYYALKFPGADGTVTKTDDHVTPLVRIPIDGAEQTVSWAWERPDGGRSFGFTGGHFHKNWERAEYRRLVTQGVLWTVKRTIPAEGIKVDATEEDLKLAPRGK